MRPIKLIVKTNSDKYSIIIGRNLISNLSQIFKKNSINFKKCLLVLDKNIPNRYITQISKSLRRDEIHKFIYNANEKNKNQRNVNKILDLLLKKNFSRDDCLISIGGGITWEMGCLYNNLADNLIPVACDWKSSDWIIANTFLQKRLLENSNNPIQDARIHAMLTYRTPFSICDKFSKH